MADPPFGFGPPGGAGRGSGSSGSGSSGGSRDDGGGMSPYGPLGDPQQFADALRQVADLMSWQGGPVNWDFAKNVARHAVAARWAKTPPAARKAFARRIRAGKGGKAKKAK